MKIGKISEKINNGLEKEVECILNKKMTKHWLMNDLVRFY